MGKLRLLFTTLVILILPHIAYSDIIITSDGMTLNGKIIEEIKDEHVKIGNYHGIFIIKHAQIKEMHKTENYQEDIKIFKKMGKEVSENEIKTNFQAGIEKLEEKKISEKKNKAVSMECLLLVSPFFIVNVGEIQSFLPYSFGALFYGDIRFPRTCKFLPNGIRMDLDYFYSERGIKIISAYRFGFGPVWGFPFEIRDFHFNLTLSPVFGAGYYTVKSRYDNTANIKWNASVSAGLEFFISSWVISPQVRFDYIYDGVLPLYGIGISIGAGYLFEI